MNNTDTNQKFNDPKLPQLEQAVDCAQMRQIFQQALSLHGALHGAVHGAVDGRSIRVRECTLDRMKYKPGKSCLILYRLCLCPAGNQAGNHRNDAAENQEQLICARFYPQGESRRRFVQAKERAVSATPSSLKHDEASILHLPELEMVAWLFPTDPKLTGLPRLMDPSVVEREILPSIVEHLLADRLATPWQIKRLDHTLIHYAPEHTCTVRVQVDVTQQDADPMQFTLYGKTYSNDEGAETHRLMQELWQESAHCTQPLTFAKPLGYDPQHRILWQLGLAGKPLIAYEDDVCFERYLQKAAAAVAALHQSAAKPKRKTERQQWLAKLSEMRNLLTQMRPERQHQTEHIIDHLLASASHLADEAGALLHGDLHLQNFLVDGEMIALIDMDNLTSGSPWQDVGSFVAGLYYRALLKGQAYEQTRRFASSFCDAYVVHSQRGDVSGAVDWYTAAALINERVYRTISRWKGGRLDFIDDLLDCAQRILGI